MFKKGTPKPPTSGRKKGVLNKDTRTFREIFEAAIGSTIPAEAARLYKLANTEGKIRIIEKVVPYCHARISTDTNINVLGDVNNNLTIDREKVEKLAKELIEIKALSVEDL